MEYHTKANQGFLRMTYDHDNRHIRTVRLRTLDLKMELGEDNSKQLITTLQIVDQDGITATLEFKLLARAPYCKI